MWRSAITGKKARASEGGRYRGRLGHLKVAATDGVLPCTLVQVDSLAQSVAASDTLAFVPIDGFATECSNTFCITVSQ